ncbi:hypothetical protein P9Y72_01215 [Bacillus cereus]|nr:hypothetical protein [Bacillus cereus]
MTIIDLKKYVNNYLLAAVKKYGGHPSSQGAKFVSTPHVSEPTWYYPAKESTNAHEISRQSGSYPNYSSTEQSYNVPIQYPVTNTSTTKTSNGFKTDKSITKQLKMNIGLTASIPAVNIGGAVIAFNPGSSVSRDSSTTENIYFSDTTERTTSTNDTPPNTTQSLKCPPNTKATYTVVYFGGDVPTDVTSETHIEGTGSITGTNSTTGKEQSQTKVLATLEYSKEHDNKKYKMVVTADQLALRISGYSPPPGVEADRGSKSLIIHGEHTVTLHEDFAYEIFVELKPLPGSNTERELYVYRFDKDKNLQRKQIIFESDVNPDLDIVIKYRNNEDDNQEDFLC